MTSSKINAGLARWATASAVLPLLAAKSLCPSPWSVWVRTCRLVGVSSTSRMLSGCSASGALAPAAGTPNFSSCDCSQVFTLLAFRRKSRQLRVQTRESIEVERLAQRSKLSPDIGHGAPFRLELFAENGEHTDIAQIQRLADGV